MPADPARLDRALNPRTIVVVGDKGPNFMWLSRLDEFTGDAYSVQLDENEIKGIEELGFTNYKSLQEVPGDVDLVICAVPREITPFIVADAIKKGVGGMSMFTSGFAETGEEKGIELQKRIVKMALDDGLPIVGPNCMGVYNRRLGVKFWQGQDQGEGGNVSVFSQSGTHAIGLTAGLQEAGVKVTRAISMGNGIVLNECDYLEYLLDDDQTELIVIYVEGTRDGPRFLRLLRQARGHKPIVLWRGGLTNAGGRAVRSHSGSLTTPREVWTALVRQTGVIPADTRDEAVDAVAALLNIPPTTKRNLALIANSGGHSVAISDAFERAGLTVPELSPDSYERLAEFFSIIGGSFRNPFDGSGGAPENLERLIDIVADDPVIDGGIVMELRTQGFGGDEGDVGRSLDRALDLLDGYRERTGKPVITVTHGGGIMAASPGSEAAEQARKAVTARGYAFFTSFERAAQALGRAIDYYAGLEAE